MMNDNHIALQRTVERVLICLYCVVLCISLLPVKTFASGTPSAEESAAGNTDAEDTAARGKVVRIGWYQSDLFQEGMSDDNPKSGYCYEYIHKVSDYNEWNYAYVYGDWTELYDKLLNGEIDLLAGVSQTEERMGSILFPDEVMGYEHYVLYQHQGGSMDASDISTLDGVKIGAITNNLMTDYLEQWLADNGAGAEIVYYDSFGERDQAFDDGEIDGLVTTNNGVLISSGYAQVAEVGKESYYLAVTKGREDLLKDLNRALDYMEDIEPYFISNLEYENYGTTLANSSLSAVEEEWLAHHDTLTIGCMDNYLPYCTENEDGSAYGIVTDVMEAILGNLEIADRLTVDYRFYSSGDDLVTALKNGEIDAAFPVGGSTWQLEQEGINATNEVVTAAMYLVCTGKYESAPARIAAAGGNAMSNNYIRARFPDAEIVEVDNIEDCLKAVKNGDADATIINGLRIDIVLQNRAYKSLQLYRLDKTAGRCFGVMTGNTGIHMLLNRGLRLIGTDFGANAAYQYMSDLYSVTVRDFVINHQIFFASIIGVILLIIALQLLRSLQRRKKMVQQEIEKNQELTRAREAAEAANAAKTDFLFNMSHDIRTPMNAIIGFRNLLEKYQDDPEKRADYLKKIEGSSNVLLSIINNVLDMARIEKGNVKLNETSCSVREFSASLCAIFGDMMREKNLQFTSDIDVEHNEIFCDSTKLQEIYTNILSNAYKYTNPGGSVTMRLKELPSDQPGTALYQTVIADTGIGMSEEYLPHIFESFSRENNTTEAKVEGTGLGMPIVKRLVEMMGGTIEVASRKGEGSVFTVTIPHRLAADPAAEEKDSKEPDLNDFRGWRILLAEDNDLNAEIAMDILSEEEFLTERAEDGKVCVEKLKSAAPGYYNLILMDIQMPNMNGYEAARAIRGLEDSDKAGIPIIAMTANAFEEDRNNALAAGMNAHLGKPIDVEQLMKTIAEVLNRKSQGDGSQ